MIIGNKDKFGIEIFSKQHDYNVGIIQLWINNTCIGEKEETYIKPVLLALKRINNLSSYQLLDITVNDIDKVFNHILSNENLYTQTLLGFGETFDEYILRPYIHGSDVVFLWTFLPAESQIRKKKILKVEFGIVSSEYYFKILNECLKTIYPNLRLG